MDKRVIKLIINPNSGKGKAREITEKIKERFEKEGFCVDLRLTEKRGDAEQWAFDDDGEELVSCVGGDGTLHETVNGLMKRERKVPVGYIPMGSVNDFARSAQIPRKWKRAVDNIINGEDAFIDVGKFNNEYFTYVAAAGIFTKMAYSTSQKLKNKLGKAAYLLLGIKDLFEYRKMHLKIDVDGTIYEDDFLFVGISNTKSIGSIVKFKGSFVQLNDGNLEVMLIKYSRNLFELAKGVHYYSRKRWNTDIFKFIHGKSIKVYDRNNVVWTLDGESSDASGDVGRITEIEIIEKGLKIRTKNGNI